MERWRPRRLARRRLAAEPPNPQQLLVTRRPRKPPIRRRDAAERAGETPAFRPRSNPSPLTLLNLRGALQTPFRRSDDFLQRQRVVHRVRGVIVVEVDVGGFQLALPIVHAFRPLVELLIRVAALVFEGCRAM